MTPILLADRVPIIYLKKSNNSIHELFNNQIKFL